MAHPAQRQDKLILCLAIFLISCQQTKNNGIENFINANELSITSTNGIKFAQNKPITGIVYALYPNKDTAYIKEFRVGKEHGTWKKYHDNGNLHEIRYYENGKKEGKFLAYWRGGELKLEYHFENDLYEGTNRVWNPDSTLIQEMNYHKGQEEGSQKVWYDNGKIKSNYVIKDGRRYGLLGTKNCTNVSDTIKVK